MLSMMTLMWAVSHKKVSIGLSQRHTKRMMDAPIFLLVLHRLFRIWLCWRRRFYSSKADSDHSGPFCMTRPICFDMTLSSVVDECFTVWHKTEAFSCNGCLMVKLSLNMYGVICCQRNKTWCGWLCWGMPEVGSGDQMAHGLAIELLVFEQHSLLRTNCMSFRRAYGMISFAHGFSFYQMSRMIDSNSMVIMISCSEAAIRHPVGTQFSSRQTILKRMFLGVFHGNTSLVPLYIGITLMGGVAFPIVRVIPCNCIKIDN